MLKKVLLFLVVDVITTEEDWDGSDWRKVDLGRKQRVQK